MAVPASIQPLVDKYMFHRNAYIRGQEKYNEAQLRQDFTDPFFHALGWDVNNNKGHSKAYRDPKKRFGTVPYLTTGNVTAGRYPRVRTLFRSSMQRLDREHVRHSRFCIGEVCPGHQPVSESSERVPELVTCRTI